MSCDFPLPAFVLSHLFSVYTYGHTFVGPFVFKSVSSSCFPPGVKLLPLDQFLSFVFYLPFVSCFFIDSYIKLF